MKTPLIAVGLVLAVVICGFGFSIQDFEATEIDKREDIMELMKLQNSTDMGVQVMKTMLDSFKASGLVLPDNLVDEFLDEVQFSELLEQIVPIYEKHLSHQDVKELIKFFQSPVGQKLIEKQPLIIQESMVVGMKWGQDISAKFLEKLKERED